MDVVFVISCLSVTLAHTPFDGKKTCKVHPTQDISRMRASEEVLGRILHFRWLGQTVLRNQFIYPMEYTQILKYISVNVCLVNFHMHLLFFFYSTV